MHFLQITGIGKQQAGNWVLKDIHIIQERFQKTAIAGETGSGKSTLLKIIAGLEQPDTGQVLFTGHKVMGPSETLILGHPGIAYLSQHFELRNNYRVEELLEYANQISEREAETLFAVCRIDHLLKRKVDQLSGGEKQRIALARLLVGSPKLLLLDEPFSNMDPVYKNILKSVLNDIGERLQITCILTSHDPVDTLSWADQVLVMKAGKIIQKASPYGVYHDPVNEYAAGLFGSYNLLSVSEASVFMQADKISQGVNGIFIRPEQFMISSTQKAAVQGRIEKILFGGSYYEMEVLIGSKKIIVKTMDTDFTRGDLVYISLKTGQLQ